jgi:hypothetical protein
MCEPVKSCGARLVHGGVRLGVGEFGAANIAKRLVARAVLVYW